MTGIGDKSCHPGQGKRERQGRRRAGGQASTDGVDSGAVESVVAETRMKAVVIRTGEHEGIIRQLLTVKKLVSKV